MKKNKHIGSNFDDFLNEEGVLEEIDEVVAKKVFAFQIESEIKKQEIDQAERVILSPICSMNSKIKN